MLLTHNTKSTKQNYDRRNTRAVRDRETAQLFFNQRNQHRGALRGTPGSVCPQPEPNATEQPSCAPISARDEYLYASVLRATGGLVLPMRGSSAAHDKAEDHKSERAFAREQQFGYAFKRAAYSKC